MSGTTIIAQISMSLRNIFQQTNIICHIFLFNKSRCITFYIGGGGGGHTCICLSARWRFSPNLYRCRSTDFDSVSALRGGWVVVGGGGGGSSTIHPPKLSRISSTPKNI